MRSVRYHRKLTGMCWVFPKRWALPLASILYYYHCSLSRSCVIVNAPPPIFWNVPSLFQLQLPCIPFPDSATQECGAPLLTSQATMKTMLFIPLATHLLLS